MYQQRDGRTGGSTRAKVQQASCLSFRHDEEGGVLKFDTHTSLGSDHQSVSSRSMERKAMLVNTSESSIVVRLKVKHLPQKAPDSQRR
jgi:hypothetical protein